MKNTNIVIMGLLLAAGPLYARLDLQKVSAWKKEDTSEWNQAKVDTILSHINANKSGNDATLRPLYKKIDEWKATQAEAVRRDLANKAAVAEAQFRAAREAEKAKAQAKYVDALNNLLQATVTQAEVLKKEVAKAEIEVKEATTPAEKTEAKTKVEETKKDLAAVTTEIKVEEKQLKEVKATPAAPEVTPTKAAADVEETLNEIEKALKEKGPNSGMEEVFARIIDNKTLPQATRTRAKNLLKEYTTKSTADTKEHLDSLESRLQVRSFYLDGSTLPFLEDVIEGKIPTTEELTLRAKQLKTKFYSYQEDEKKLAPIGKKIRNHKPLTPDERKALQEFATKYPFEQENTADVLADDAQLAKKNAEEMIGTIVNKVKAKTLLTKIEISALESFASSNPTAAAEIKGFLTQDEQNKKEKPAADKAAKEQAAKEIEFTQRVQASYKTVAEIKSPLTQDEFNKLKTLADQFKKHEKYTLSQEILATSKALKDFADLREAVNTLTEQQYKNKAEAIKAEVFDLTFIEIAEVTNGQLKNVVNAEYEKTLQVLKDKPTVAQEASLKIDEPAELKALLTDKILDGYFANIAGANQKSGAPIGAAKLTKLDPFKANNRLVQLLFEANEAIKTFQAKGILDPLHDPIDHANDAATEAKKLGNSVYEKHFNDLSLALQQAYDNKGQYTNRPKKK